MLQRLTTTMLLGLATLSGSALAGPTLPTGGTGVFAKLSSFLQDLVDFMSGPFGTTAVIVSIIIGFVTWTFAPKEGIMGVVLRTVVTAIVILNVGAWIISFRS